MTARHKKSHKLKHNPLKLIITSVFSFRWIKMNVLEYYCILILSNKQIKSNRYLVKI